MGILIWIAMGAAAGLIATAVMPGPVAGGLTVSIPIGIAGAIAGGMAGWYFGVASFDAGLGGFLCATSGALAVLFCYRANTMRGAS